MGYVKGAKSGADLVLNLDPIDYVVDGMIQAKTVNIAVGDSGIGKSPLLYQLGLSVSVGMPFLGMKTKAGPVLLLDYENGEQRGVEIAHTIARFMGLEKMPETFFRWNEADAFDMWDTLIGSIKPRLVIIDPLRYFDPKAELDNPRAAEMLGNLHKLAHKHSSAFLILHHTRKNRDPKFPPPRLDDLNVSPLSWCEEAAGPRAFINQTHSRIGLARGEGDSAVILRGHLKTEGEFGPIYIERVLDDNGEAIGYQARAGGSGLTPEHLSVLARLPIVFTFRMVKLVTGKANATVARLMTKFLASGAISQNRQAKTYTKLI